MKLRTLGLVACAALPWLGAGGDATRAAPEPATATTTIAAPEIAVLVGAPEGDSTSLHFVAMDGPGTAGSGAPLGPAVARFDHAKGAAIRAVTGPAGAESSTVFVIADVAHDEGAPERDPSFDGALLRLRAGDAPTTLADRVVHASRPVVAPGGEVLVARGERGAPSKSALRVDVLWVDEIDPETAAARTLTSLEGYLLYVIGATDAEALVYRVSPSGADIVAIDRRTKNERVVEKTLPPFARDFSLDPSEKTLVYLDRVDADPIGAGGSAAWHVVRVDLATLAEKELHRGSSMTVVPFALPNGDVLVSLDPAKGPSTLFGPAPALGQGVAEPAGISSDRAFLTGEMRAPGGPGRPFVLDLARDVARFVDVPIDERAVVAGFVTSDARGSR